ncbi:unnamed protein product [Lampetra fluviatilis]
MSPMPPDLGIAPFLPSSRIGDLRRQPRVTSEERPTSHDPAVLTPLAPVIPFVRQALGGQSRLREKVESAALPLCSLYCWW